MPSIFEASFLEQSSECSQLIDKDTDHVVWRGRDLDSDTSDTASTCSDHSESEDAEGEHRVCEQEVLSSKSKLPDLEQAMIYNGNLPYDVSCKVKYPITLSLETLSTVAPLSLQSLPSLGVLSASSLPSLHESDKNSLDMELYPSIEGDNDGKELAHHRAQMLTQRVCLQREFIQGRGFMNSWRTNVPPASLCASVQPVVRRTEGTYMQTSTSKGAWGTTEGACMQVGDSSNIGEHGLEPPRRGRALRPCKGKRERYRKLVTRLREALEADPLGFDLHAVPLPPSIAENPAAIRKLYATLQKGLD